MPMMIVRQRPRQPHWTVQKLTLLLMLLATLFPLYAPWLNANFAAIQPGHQHLFVGDVNPDHHHPSQLAELLPHPHPQEAVAGEVINLPNLLAGVSMTPLPAAPLTLLVDLCAGLTTAVFDDNLAVTLFTQRHTTPPPR